MKQPGYKFDTVLLPSLLAALLFGCVGCGAHWCHFPDQCAEVLYDSQLGWELHDVCNCDPVLGCGEGIPVSQCCNVIEPRQKRPPRFVVGPPAVPYEPPLPPKFLPVPARSVFAATNPAAPTLQRSQVEHNYRHELEFPAGN